MIKYLGSKRTLIPALTQLVGELPEVRTVCDLFSGTSRVGHALKREGFQVFANDLNTYAATLARCYVQADLETWETTATALLKELNGLAPKPGYFTHTFCEQSRFFQPKNGARVDAIRNRISELSLEPELEAIALVALMEAADRVDSTTGVQMAYLKQWAPRAHNDLQLRLPAILPQAGAGKGRAMQMDALKAAAEVECDLVYVDPPYNQHRYLSNYHIWETLVLWDEPEVYGRACKRIDCRTRKSAFNSKKTIVESMKQTVANWRSPYAIVSFNNEGYIQRELMEQLLSERGHVYTFEHDFKRYVGAQIGIYNPQGAKVGRVSHLRNKEYLYVVTPEPMPAFAAATKPEGKTPARPP